MKLIDKQRVRNNRQNCDRNKILDELLSFLFLLSVVLVVWGINIYRRTIIAPKYLLMTVGLGTAVSAIVLLLTTAKFLNAIWIFFWAAAIGGSTTYFLTLYLNRELANKEVTSEIFNIQETGNLAKGRKGTCRSPYAVIDFHDFKKQLVF